jgi:hypothetical protein
MQVRSKQNHNFIKLGCLFGGYQWCSAWSWVRIFVMFVFSGVINGGVVHVRGFESLTFGESMVV